MICYYEIDFTFWKSILNCYVLEENNENIISTMIYEIESRQMYNWVIDEFEKLLLHKIHSCLLLFKENWYRACMPYIRNLGWVCFELRIKLPWSNNLLRLIFILKWDKILLFTGWFIKPRNYSDKRNKTQINKKYNLEIEKSKKILEDFECNQKLNYQLLYTL